MAISYTDSPYETLNPDLRARVEAAMKAVTYQPNQHLFRANEISCGLIWIQSGIVLSYQMDDEGAYRLAMPLYRGVWTAPSVVTGNHSLSHRAITAAQVSILPPDMVQRFLVEAEFNALVTQWVAEDFALVANALTTHADADITETVMAFLKTAIKYAGRDPNAKLGQISGTIDWPFTITEMAKHSRLSRPYLSRIIGELKRKGQLQIADGKLTVIGNDAGV